MTRSVLPEDGRADYYPSIFTIEENNGYLQELTENIQWVQEPIVIFGKRLLQPRLTAFYGDTGKVLFYSGISMQPKPWTSALLKIKAEVEKLSSVKFTSVLLNLYRHGQDSMGWHRDNEKELGPDPVIASVSFGQERDFHFRHHNKKENRISISLAPGSVLIMGGTTQKNWEHCLPKRASAKLPRINLTFRSIGNQREKNKRSSIAPGPSNSGGTDTESAA